MIFDVNVGLESIGLGNIGMENMAAFYSGLITSISLIMAIGAQNAFVLSQGLRRQFNLEIALVCCSLDALLIFAGVAGMGVLVSSNPILMKWIALFGALFLTAYGARALLNVFTDQSMKTKGSGVRTAYQAVALTASISLLNPHVYLDTVVLLGSIGSQYAIPYRWWFAAGATLASVIWFFALSFGSARLAPIFEKAVAWKVLDGAVCLMMWSIAAGLWQKVLTA